MKGIVVLFDAKRGYGFIRPDDGRQDVFVHISQVQGRQELEVGQKVVFEVRDTERGPSAHNVVPGRRQSSPITEFAVVALVLSLSGTLLMTSLLGLHWLLAWFLSISVVTLFLFGFDKQSARTGGVRVPEKVLHGLALLGGSPGALLGMRLFHHKTAKREFRVVMWLIVLAQCAFTLYLQWR